MKTAAARLDALQENFDKRTEAYCTYDEGALDKLPQRRAKNKGRVGSSAAKQAFAAGSC